MPKLEFEIEFKRVEEKSKRLPVIIVAAGTSSRMNGTDKQFALIGGIPVLARTLSAFEKSPFISEITVVTREEKIAEISKLGSKYAISKLKNVIEGGESREQSVNNGVLLYKGLAEKVLVHDGARPLVSGETIEKVVSALDEFDSVTCAVKVKDTIKRADKNGIVTETLNRDELLSVQTPQGVNVEKFLAAANGVDLSKFTDDTSVMESLGEKTKITEGNTENIKITTPEDILVAEAYIGKEW